ncbi:ABC transporter permease [Streptosporangium sp. NPDC000563]|uniref:ABC transporter permease n=1 Tax=unclassified Streptosporangium TaxID=2632669 RepID=UPI00332D917E
MVAAETATPRVPLRGAAHNLRAVKVVLRRELIRFATDGKRVTAMLFQAFMWIFIIGTGFGSLMPGVPDGVDLKTFMFPGVISMTVILTAMFSASSIVWDREFGFLREMLVAPVSRTAIVVGKILGGALVATLQSLVIVAMAGLVGVPYDPVLIVSLVGVMFLTAFTMSAFGVLVAARMTSMESFQGIAQMAIMPLMYLSGALFPLTNLPGWMSTVTLLNPLTYAVDPARQVVFAHLSVPPEVMAVYGPGVSWSGWAVPMALELLLVGGAGLLMLALAVARFHRTG